MNVFIVHAHHEPRSFNGALTRAASEGLAAAGHQARISDLHAMGFNPVSDRRNFTTVKDPAYIKQQAEEQHAAQAGGFAPDIQAEMDKLDWCDALIFQFPLWWFGPPAILKGWVDRVFAMGRIYGGGKWYDRGAFVGKRAMCSITIGARPDLYTPRGLNGDINTILFPIHHGIFAFTGFTVVQPFLVHGPARITHEERVEHLARYRSRVLDIMSAPTIDYPKLADFDERCVLKQP